MRTHGISPGIAALIAAGALAVSAGALSADPPRSVDVYPLDTCIVTGGKLGGMGNPVVKDIGGREYRFCCAGCVKKVEADPAAYAKKLDEAVLAQQRPTYPLDTCLVMQKKLNPASTIEIVRGDRLFRLCCADCSKEVSADPAKFRALLDESAAEAQRPDYPLTTCVVSGKALGDTPTALVASGRLVLFCSEDCAKAFEKAPAQYLGLLDDAAPGRKAGSPASPAPATATAPPSGCGGGCCK